MTSDQSKDLKKKKEEEQKSESLFVKSKVVNISMQNFCQTILSLVCLTYDQKLDVLLASLTNSRGSRVAGRGSRVAGRGSRVQSRDRGSNVAVASPKSRSRVQCRGREK